MPGLFQGISTMTGALRAFQRGLDVTGHNISNVNTAGYSRQSVQFNELDPTRVRGMGEFLVGNGVTAASVSRIQDQFLFIRQTQAGAESGRLNAMFSGLSNVQALLNEPGGASVNDALNKLFNSFSALGSNPSDPALRQQVQQAGSTLATRVRNMYSELSSQVSQTQTAIAGTLQEAQNLTNAIASMNLQIREEQANGNAPNDLLDLRDQAIQKLGTILPLTVTSQQDGTVAVFAGQLTLVDSLGAKTIPTSLDSATGSLVDGAVSYPVRSGSIAGLFQTGQKIEAYKQQLDTLANTLRTQFNSVHATGTNLLGASGQNFFNDGSPQTGAIDFDVDAVIKADPRAIAAGVTGNPGDGGLAISLSGLRDSQIAALGNKTFGGFYGDLVAGVGQEVALTESLVDTSQTILMQIEQQVQSVSGVSLDDEMSNMLRFQRSYQAAAKALSIFDQTTEDLLSILR